METKSKITDKTKAINYEPMLPALGTDKKNPLCGSKLQGAELTETKVKINKYGEVFEFWNQAPSVQTPKWVRTSKYNYCKRCLSALNGR